MTISLSEAIGNSPAMVGDLLDWPARLYPTRPAIESSVNITFEELRERSILRAGILANFGVRRFQRWGLIAENSPEFFISLFGLARLGAVVAPISHDQIGDWLSQAVCEGRLAGLIVPGSIQRAAVEAIAPGLKLFEEGDKVRILALTRPDALADSKQPIDVDPALIIWSSGSTRAARGVVLQHSAVLANIRSNVRALGLCDADRTLVVLPVAHAYALIHQCLCHLAIGATICCPPVPILAPSLCRHLEEFKITTLATVPAVLKMLTESFNRTKRACSRLRLVTVGASRANRITLAEAMELLPNTRFAITYGLTEAGPRVATGFVEPGNIDPACVGTPLPNVELRLERRRDGSAEIYVRGRSLMRSYADEAWEEGRDHSLRTSDLGEVQDGRLYVRGRLDRAINRGGVLISAEPIEEVLLRHPAIQRARVEPQPHPFWGEVPVATLLLRDVYSEPSPEDLRRFCAQWLPASEVPVHFEMGGKALAVPAKERRMSGLLEDDCGTSAAATACERGGLETG